MAMVLAGRLIAMVEEVAALVVGREYLFLLWFKVIDAEHGMITP